MTHHVLSNCLRPIIDAETRWRKRRVVTLGLFAGSLAMIILVVIARTTGWWSSSLALVTVIGSLLSILAGWLWVSHSQINLKSLAKSVEAEHPDLNSLLLTALDMEIPSGGRLGYLQSQVLGKVTEHAIKNRWVRQVSEKKLIRAGHYRLGALVAFMVGAWLLMVSIPKTDLAITNTVPDPAAPNAQIEVTISPGDVEVEKGSRIVVEATFAGRTPAGAMIVLTDPEDGSIRGRLPMKAGHDDSVFSAIVEKVASKTNYEVRFEEAGSDRFTITTYEHPDLKQADATVTPPAYTGQAPTTTEDTLKVSLLEGSQLSWSMKVNKPVADAELFGEDGSIIKLKATSADPTVLTATHLPDKTQKYRLHLIDDKDRANKLPPWLSVTVKQNLPPKLEFAFPRRDVDVSSLEEMTVEAQVWDDLGLQNVGIVFAHGDQQKEVILASTGLPGNEKHKLSTQLAIEELGAKPRDLITYHLWAEDFDREGKVRRTQSDMFLAELRLFEDIFREQEGQSGPPGEPGQSEQLLKLQKDILNATWKVLREAQLGKPYDALKSDINVIQESQVIAIQKTDETIGKVDDPELKSFFEEAKAHMEAAVKHFQIEKPESTTKAIELAYSSVRSAYESLIKARARETNITRSDSPSQGQPQEKEQQLMNLELKQKEIKYKENTAAEPEKAAEQKENLEVLNKLKELARRQEAIAKKIKELQNQLEEAKTKEEKEQIEKQLKRLQEEQEELLRDLDTLSERMDQDENRANMAEERKKLEETRENIRESAKKLEEQKLADAANSATRAQRELEAVEDEFRKKTSRQFTEEMKNLRNAARELAENQKDISKKLDDKAPADTNSGNYFRTPKENMELVEQLEAQSENLEKLVGDLKKISEESEEAEPLLSNSLYEAVRSTTVNGVGESLAEATRMIRYNRRNAARDPEQNAAQGIGDLKDKVEKAAEKILGSEADALRLARNELDRLIDVTKSEAERLEGKKNGEPGKGEQPGDSKGQDGKDGKGQEKGKTDGSGKGDDPKGQKGEGKGQGKGKGEEPGEMAGTEPGQGKGDGKGKGKGEQPGEMAGTEPGEGKGKGKGTEKGEAPGEGKGDGKGEGKGDGQDGKSSSEMAGTESGKGKGKGEGKGKGQVGGEGQEESEQPGGQERGRSLLSQGARNGQRSVGSNFGGDDRGSHMPSGLAQGPPRFFEQSENEDSEPAGPITGEDYKDFANALGNIEEMMPEEDLRNDIAKILDNARRMRIDFKRDNAPPGAPAIRQKIVDPLVELRARVSEELAKLNKENPLAPIDRDPVPGEFRDLVKKYYEELGGGN